MSCTQGVSASSSGSLASILTQFATSRSSAAQRAKSTSPQAATEEASESSAQRASEGGEAGAALNVLA